MAVAEGVEETEPVVKVQAAAAVEGSAPAATLAVVGKAAPDQKGL